MSDMAKVARRGKAHALRALGHVVALAARERVGLTPPPTAGTVPRSLDDVTPQWLTSALCSGVPGTRVTAVSTAGESTGTTTRRRLELAYDGDGHTLPRHLFVKCTSALAQRVMLGLGGFIADEVCFYDQVRTGLDIEAPRGYFGAVEPRAWRSIVLLEDVVATRGARFWEPGTPTTRAQIEALLSQAARWHGALWDSRRLRQWEWLRTPGQHMELIDALLGLADRTRAGAARAGAAIPVSVRRRGRDLREAMRRSMALASQGPRTYLHGDLHVANTYLTATGATGIADWQVGLQGSWSYDYAYLLSTALTVEDRRAWEHDLLAHYLDELRAAGGPHLAREDAWLAYRRGTFYPYFAWLYTLGRSRLQPRFQPDAVCVTLIGRIASAIEDLESFAAVGL